MMGVGEKQGRIEHACREMALKIRTPKHEIRNKSKYRKQKTRRLDSARRSSRIQLRQGSREGSAGITNHVWIPPFFLYLNLFRISCFGFRIFARIWSHRPRSAAEASLLRVHCAAISTG